MWTRMSYFRASRFFGRNAGGKKTKHFFSTLSITDSPQFVIKGTKIEPPHWLLLNLITLPSEQWKTKSLNLKSFNWVIWAPALVGHTPDLVLKWVIMGKLLGSELLGIMRFFLCVITCRNVFVFFSINFMTTYCTLMKTNQINSQSDGPKVTVALQK